MVHINVHFSLAMLSMLTLEHVTTDEVVNVIRLLPQKSSPLDVMPVSLLKLSADIMAPLIEVLEFKIRNR